MALSFGTAGMRAPLGPMPEQINVGQITRLSAAVARWFSEQALSSPHSHGGPEPSVSRLAIGAAFHEEDPALRVVVGFDARYGSSIFATATAEVFAGAGIEVFLMPTPTPTPLVPYLIRAWGLDGGVQITASHNPAADNGYKVYMPNGRLVTVEHSDRIEELFAEAPEASLIPRVFVRPAADQLRRYVDDVVELIKPEQADLLRVNNERAGIRIAVTAMHGVGGRAVTQALQASGFAQVLPVMEQHYPDPTFPTVTYPNPEEPTAVARLLEYGEEVGADLLVALDPDADRCAIGVRGPDGALCMLRGDETGPLLATRLIPRWSGEGPRPIVATTAVSTRLLGAIARDRGWEIRETHTGFKNVMAAAGEQSIAFGCEEAMGIAPAPWLVDDKDGIATALVACAWAAELKAQGRTLIDELDSLHRQYGVFVGTQIPVRTISPSELIGALAENSPSSIAGIPITSHPLPGFTRDWGVLMFGDAADGSHLRIIARSSGTEKKTKIYIEISGAPSKADARELLARTEADLHELLQRV